MKSQRSGVLVNFLCLLAAAALTLAAGYTYGAEPAPPAAPAQVQSKIVSMIVIGLDGDPELLEFIGDHGEHMFVLPEVCIANPACVATFEALDKAGKVDAVNLRTKSPDTLSRFIDPIEPTAPTGCES